MDFMRMAALAAWLFLPMFGQVTTTLRIVSAAPSGELTRMDDAGEVRIVFSEPMVALGGAPLEAAPSWLTMTPAVPGTFYWSGTTTLVFSPAPLQPLPFATKFTVGIASSATSVRGATLATPYEQTFTTPTPTLMGVQWRRTTGRFDDPAVLELTFNQPMTPEVLLPHLTVSLRPHGWTAPKLSADARRMMARTDAAGLARFDAKVARVREDTLKSDRFEVRASTAKPRQEPLRNPERIVMLETTTAPPTSALLDIALDGSLRGVQGPETHPVQSSVIALDQAFFVTGTDCESACDPDRFAALHFPTRVESTALSKALTITDVTRSSARVRVQPGGRTYGDDGRVFWLAGLGYEHQPPSRTWQLRVSSDLRSIDGQTLGYPWIGVMSTAHTAPFLGMNGVVWEAGAGPSVPFTTRNITSLRQEIGAVGVDEVVPRLRELDNNEAFRGTKRQTLRRVRAAPNDLHLNSLDARQLLSPRGTGIFTTALAAQQTLAGSRDSGVALLDRGVVQVTNLGVTVKDSRLSTLVFVTRLDSGAPVANASVTVRDASNTIVWRGSTDDQGIALGHGVKVSTQAPAEPRALTVMVEKEGDIGFVRTKNREDVPWLDEDPARAMRLHAFAFTDRGVYRPNEEMHSKALIRAITPDGLQPLPANTAISVSIRDWHGDTIDVRQLRTNEWGGVDWTWRVPARASLGVYGIFVALEKAQSDDDLFGAGSFLVAAYRRPDFQVDATLTADSHLRGSTLRAGAQARYLFGASLGEENVEWRLYSRTEHRAPPALVERYPEERYSIGYLPRRESGDVVENKETLSRDGRLALDLPTATDESGAAFLYMFEADVEDAARQHIANRASLVLHPASIYVVLSRPPYFVDSGKSLSITVTTADLAGNTVAGADVAVSLVREQWIHRRHDEEGPDWESQETPVGQWTIRTTSAETPIAIPVRDGGSYILRATARDGAGRLTRTEASFYAFGGTVTGWRTEDTRHVELIPERTVWKVGERGRVLVQSPWPEAMALVTVEREGIRRHFTTAIRSTQDKVEIPVTPEDCPGIFVSVTLIKGRTSTTLDADGADSGRPSYALGYTRIDVEDPSKQLQVQVSTDKTEYRPGGVANVAARVTGADGRPVSAEVTLWAVDHGLLTLTNYTTPDPQRAMRGGQSLFVSTTDSRLFVIGRGPVAPPARRMMMELVTVQASTGERSESPTEPLSAQGLEVRTDFRPVAFWLGSSVTDADGVVTTTVKLPDSLTTYRVMAIAADRGSSFGSGQLEVRVNKPLTLLPSLPRFLTRGDRASLTAILTSQRATGGRATVTIESLTPDRLRWDGAQQQSISVAPGVSVPVTFDAIAQSGGPTRIRMRVTFDGESDAFEVPLDVSEPIRLHTSAAYGETTGTAIERLTLPSTAIPGRGGLTVDLASTALVGLGEPARYLDEYQYGCAEQKSSRALALVLAAELGQAFKLSTIQPADYRDRAIAALNELYRFHCEDGGFALWEGECRTQATYLTAYVLHVLKLGDRISHAPDGAAVEAALTYLEQRLAKQAPADWWSLWSLEQAYALKVLAEYGRKPNTHVATLMQSIDRLPIVAMSYLADALALIGDRGSQYQDLVRRLSNAVRIDADRAHVEETDERSLGWAWTTNVNATAAVLDGLVRRKDDVTFAAPLVRWLIAAQKGGHWGSTHENALTLEALANYHRTLEVGTSDMTAVVNLGSRTVGRATIAARSTASQQVTVPIADLAQAAAPSETELSLSRVGDGRLYYTARMQYAAPESAGAVDRGFSIARQYEPYVEKGAAPPQSSFNAGDLVRVRVSVTVRGEARYLAVTDPLPAGFEAVESGFATTAQRIAEEAGRSDSAQRYSWLWDDGFDHIERHDDRIVAFATRLRSGTHELTYLVRATTAGRFTAAGARVEVMYAPELEGRSAAATIAVVPRRP